MKNPLTMKVMRVNVRKCTPEKILVRGRGLWLKVALKYYRPSSLLYNSLKSLKLQIRLRDRMV